MNRNRGTPKSLITAIDRTLRIGTDTELPTRIEYAVQDFIAQRVQILLMDANAEQEEILLRFFNETFPKSERGDL